MKSKEKLDVLALHSCGQITEAYLDTSKHLIFYGPIFPSYRNKSADLLCKSTDWFLYGGSIGR